MYRNRTVHAPRLEQGSFWYCNLSSTFSPSLHASDVTNPYGFISVTPRINSSPSEHYILYSCATPSAINIIGAFTLSERVPRHYLHNSDFPLEQRRIDGQQIQVSTSAPVVVFRHAERQQRGVVSRAQPGGVRRLPFLWKPLGDVDLWEGMQVVRRAKRPAHRRVEVVSSCRD